MKEKKSEMLSWFTRKICWFMQRKAKREKPTAILQTKWHKACHWLAHSVGGVDMLFRGDRSIMVISRASLNPESLSSEVISRSKGGSIRSHLHVNLLSEAEDRQCVFKTIDFWSEELARFVATLISLSKDPDPNFDPSEGRWGVMVFTPANSDGLSVKTEMLFPSFKSEEELFMRMALDGFDINDDEEKKEKDSTDAQD